MFSNFDFIEHFIGAFTFFSHHHNFLQTKQSTTVLPRVRIILYTGTTTSFDPIKSLSDHVPWWPDTNTTGNSLTQCRTLCPLVSITVGPSAAPVFNIGRVKPLKHTQVNFNSWTFTHISVTFGNQIHYCLVFGLRFIHLGKFPPPPYGEIKMKYPDHTLYSKHICLKATAESGTFL